MDKKVNALSSDIVKEYGLNAGASIVGIAAAKDFCLAPEGFKPTDIMKECLSVIVLGTPSPKEALLKTSIEYTANRNVMLNKMTNTAKTVAKKLTTQGYKAKAISASGGKTVDGKLYGHISLKHAAELAGLGHINRIYLLTNTQHGQLLWLSAVLTNADLPQDKEAQYKTCDNCNKCVKTFPSEALNDPTIFGKKECTKFLP